jgi:hypothetical protein
VLRFELINSLDSYSLNTLVKIYNPYINKIPVPIKYALELKLSIDELNISNKKYDDPNAANNINRYTHLAAFFPNVTTR